MLYFLLWQGAIISIFVCTIPTAKGFHRVKRKIKWRDTASHLLLWWESDEFWCLCNQIFKYSILVGNAFKPVDVTWLVSWFPFPRLIISLWSLVWRICQNYSITQHCAKFWYMLFLPLIGVVRWWHHDKIFSHLYKALKPIPLHYSNYNSVLFNWMCW